MTTPRVQRHRKTKANRRRVTTRGKRVPQPRARPRNVRPSRRTKRRTGATVGVLGLLTAICSFGGAVFTVAGAVTTAAGGVTVAWIEYRRDLIEVKRTGKPIGQPKPAPQRPASHSTEGLSVVPEPKPVDLDKPAKVAEVLYGGKWTNCKCGKAVPITNGSPAAHDCQKPPVRKPPSKAWPPKGHNPKCRAKSAATCRCPKGRAGAKRKTS